MKQSSLVIKLNIPVATLSLVNNFRLIHKFLLIAMVLLANGIFALGQSSLGKTFIVSPTGADTNPGTILQPMVTLEAARDAARLDKTGSHRIIVMPGEYFLSRPFELDSRDNGLTIEADSSGKVILYGGFLVTGWKRDGDKFWAVDIPGVKEGTYDFRALVVNDRMPLRARMPESGTFIHKSTFDVQYLTNVAGEWARKPTPEELTTMYYDPKDIPASLDVRNAEVRVYHMWDESFIGVKQNDTNRNKLIFTSPTINPAGAFGIKDYIVWNTREGMTKPGQWYLDRTTGKLVYWPLDGEDITKAKIIAPKLERIISINGTQDKKVENITIRGLTLQATTMPLKSASWGGTAFEGALSVSEAHHCKLEKIEVFNAGGLGISALKMDNCSINNCHVHNIGACGVRIDGSNILFKYNHIHSTGIYYPSSVALYAFGGVKNHIYRNEIHDTPYSGMIVGIKDVLVEENLIYRAMREIHDGAAIYTTGGSDNVILRGNVVRDVKAVVKGRDAAAYYLDEGAHDCIVERNVSIGVPRPSQNHIVRNTIIRDNVFITDEDMSLTFLSSTNMTFERNTLIANGKIKIRSSSAVTSWKDNNIFSDGRGNDNMPQAFTIGSAMPIDPMPAHKTKPIEIPFAVKVPMLDGELATDEWTGEFQRLDRLPSRWPYSGAPVIVKFSWDKRFLYIGAIMAMFEPEKISKGSTWGKNDGVEISLSGFTSKGTPVTYVIRTYFDGTIQSVTDGGASASAAENLGKKVKFISKMKPKHWGGGGWIGEWAIPFEALGLRPKPDLKVAFNMCAYVNEYDNWHCWEGTQGESWQVDKAGILQFK